MDADLGHIARIRGIGFPAVFETPSADEIRLGTLVQWSRMGLRISTADEARTPGWGMGPESTELDSRNQYAEPSASAEALRMIDIQRCVDVDPSMISESGIAYEIAHTRIPSGAVAVIEDLPTIWHDVTALDALGVPYHSYGGLDGSRPCLDELIHPDIDVSSTLRWRFALTYSDDPSLSSPGLSDLAYLGPVLPAEILGHPITAHWADARMGVNALGTTHRQFLTPSSCVIRYWIVLTGPTDRFRVSVGARLSGYWQPGGRKSAALDGVLTRRV